MYLLARGLLSLSGAVAGLVLAQWLTDQEVLSGPINLVYLTLAGLLIGYLVSPPIARRWVLVWQRLSGRVKRIPPDAILAAGVGATVALLITVLLNSVLESIPGFTWYFSLLLALVLVTASSWFFVVNRQLFAGQRLPPPATSSAPTRPSTSTFAKVVDTSAIIDGRIVDVAEANFIDSRLLIPHFVLGELQHIADSDDPLRRKRGRRGLDMLDRLVQGRSVSAEVVNDDFADVPEVDAKLVKLCLERNADLITTDFNLNRVAALQGVKVLNVNQLANAVKASYLPGELLALHIVRAGREPGQGLAYLEDGTMVVVEDSAHLVGNTVQTVVTSNLQTNMGRMIFARMQEDN